MQTVAPSRWPILDKPDIRVPSLPGQAPKGLVDPVGAAQRIRLATIAPPAALAQFVDYFWVVEWAVDTPQRQRVLPYPNAHLVFERGLTAIHGVVRGAFERKVTGAGAVLGVRFRPGGLRPFIGVALSRLTGTTLRADTMLGIDSARAEALVLDAGDDTARVAAAAALLLAVTPAPDARVQLAASVVEMVAAPGGPATVAALAAACGIGERALQRLFSEYVGVSPKWVIQRFRLQEAAWLLSRRGPIDLAALSAQLGFFDQAHFTRDFTRLVGTAPLAYWKTQQTGS